MVQPIDFEPPPCKSAFQRALFLALLRGGVTRLEFAESAGVPRDVEVLRDVLVKLGARIETRPGVWSVESSGWPSPTAGAHRVDFAADDSEAVDFEESATAARIFVALAACLGGTFELDAAASLRRRPLGADFVELLSRVGATIEWRGRAGCLPLSIESPGMVQEKIALDLDIAHSSQGASGVLLALALRGGALRVRGPLAYLPVTMAWIRAFGGAIEMHDHEDGSVTFACAASLLRRETTHVIPTDLSAACFFWAWAAGHGVPAIVRGARIDGPGAAHPDLKFVLDLEQAGINVQRDLEPRISGRMTPGDHREASYDDRPDCVAPLTAMLSARRGRHVLRASKLRFKESDRLEVLRNGLVACGFESSIDDDGLVFTGCEPGEVVPTHVPRIETHGDHRMAMCFAVLASVHGFDVVIDDRSCVAKSFPNFWRELARWERVRTEGRQDVHT